MKLKDIPKSELETMSYSEITSMILSEKGSKMKIVDVFKQICKILELSDKEFEDKIADYFELITIDKNFIILDKGYCDLKTRHNKAVVIEDDEESVEDDIDEEVDEEESDNEDEESEKNIFYDDEESDDDIEDDDSLDDFVVVDDEEEETSI